MNAYGWLKVAHVVAVIVWLGGSMALGALTGSFLRAGERAALSVYFKEAGFYGPMIVGPASLLTLLTGLGMAFMTRSFGALWVQIGFGGIVLHFVLGAGLIRAASMRVGQILNGPEDRAALAAAGKRLRILNLLYLLLMFSVVAVMVLKPV